LGNRLQRFRRFGVAVLFCAVRIAGRPVLIVADYTTDYNYQAAYFGLFSDNRPGMASPLFANVELYWRELGSWRASMPTWGSGFHAIAAAMSENEFWDRESLSPSGTDRVPAGYQGVQLPTHWSIFPYAYFGGDWVRTDTHIQHTQHTHAHNL
jgi:hypothetical protein